MKLLIQSVDGRTSLEEHGWEIAMANFHKDPVLADELLNQIDNELDRVYCQGVAYGLWAFLEGVDELEKEPFTLH